MLCAHRASGSARFRSPPHRQPPACPRLRGGAGPGLPQPQARVDVWPFAPACLHSAPHLGPSAPCVWRHSLPLRPSAVISVVPSSRWTRGCPCPSLTVNTAVNVHALVLSQPPFSVPLGPCLRVNAGSCGDFVVSCLRPRHPGLRGARATHAQQCTRMSAHRHPVIFCILLFFNCSLLSECEVVYCGFFNFSIAVDVQYPVSFRCATWWLDTYMPYEVTPR